MDGTFYIKLILAASMGGIISIGRVANSGNVIFTVGDRISLVPGFRAEGYLAASIAAVTGNLSSTTKDYCQGIEYSDSQLEAIYFSGGRLFYDSTNPTYQYVIVDYQGNTRVLFQDNGSGVGS